MLFKISKNSHWPFVFRLADVDKDNSEAARGHKNDFMAMDSNKDQNLDAIEVKEFYQKLDIFMN